MANPEHLQILQPDGAAWNVWREQHRDITRRTSAEPTSAVPTYLM